MADPNYASDRDKAEGERWSDQSSESESGISNRSMDEKKPLDTPRRYEQPIEDDEDPVMPSDDATVNTKI